MKTHRILSYLAMALLLAAAGCTRDFTEPSFDDDADGKVSLKIGLAISDAQSLQTRGEFLNGVNPRPDGDYLQALNLYLFVFEDNGSPQTNYLRELVHGRDIPKEDWQIIEDSHQYTDGDAPASKKPLLQFKARMNGTAEKAIIHIVATADPDFEKQLEYVPDRSEFGIFTGANGLSTSVGDAYWKRIVLDTPINKDTKEAIQLKLSHVNLVRNFCRVTLAVDNGTRPDGTPYPQGDAGNAVRGFVPQAFVVVNAVDRGYVAAYNERTGQSEEPGFVDFEDPASPGQPRTYRDLTDNEHYVPARHPASKREYADDDTGWTTAFENGTDMSPKYMFERAVQAEHHTFVIVKGLFAGQSKPSYIKLDIGTRDKERKDPDGAIYGVFEDFNLLRNFSYDITITHITTTNVGHDTAEGALGAPAANSVSTSIETRPLTSINDGVDKMQVNRDDKKTTVVIVDKEEGTNPDGSPRLVPSLPWFDMTWHYAEEIDPETKTGGRVVSDQVKWNYPGYAFAFDGGADPDGIIARWDGSSKTASTDTPVNNTNGNDSKDYGDGWRGFRLYFNTPDEITRQKTIRLYKPFGLTRDVTFISHKRWEFVDSRPELEDINVEVYPGSYSYLPENAPTMPFETLDEMRQSFNYGDYQDGEGYVGSQRNAQLTVMFELPADLPEAIFPLDFKIGFDRQNAENAYVGDAVVTWGESLFKDDDPALAGVWRMQFIKTISWDYYQKHKIVCARFLTTTDVFKDADGATRENGEVYAQTRVRVQNDYFKPGDGRFERSSHQDVIDPTRTRWHWNFNYPEWTNYFATYTGKASDPYNLNNLSLNTSYQATYNTRNEDGLYNIRIGGGSKANPDFSFPVDIAAEQFRGTLTIQAWANSRNGKSGNSYAIYDRDIYAGVYYTVGESEELQFLQVGPKDCNTGTNHDNQNIQYVQFPLSEFNVPDNARVTKFIIWSEKDSYPYNENNWRIQDVATNYRDILLLLNN